MGAQPGHERRPSNELKLAIKDFLESKAPEAASISEIRAGCADRVGQAPASSYRSALQDERLFERIQRGVFRFRQAS